MQVNHPTRAVVVLGLSFLITATGATQHLPPVRKTKVDPAKHIVALDPRWTVTLETAPAAAAGFDEQTAYVPLKTGQLVAVELDGGDVRWKIELATRFAPATGDGLVFAAADDEVVALVEGTGETAWKTPAGGAIAGPIYFDAGSVVVTTTDGELLALRAEDGTVAWRRPLGAPLAARPAAAGERLFVALNDRRVLALARESGEPSWSYLVDDVPTGVLALDDQVVIGTRGNRVYSLKSDNARLRWTWRVGGDVAGAPLGDDKHIYIAALDNVLRALDRHSGNIRWTQPLPSRPSGGPLRTADVVIVPTVSADIGAYATETGTPAFTIKAAGEVGGTPYLREAARPTAPRLVAVSRDGLLQGFAPRYEPPPVPLAVLPGTQVGS